MVVWRGLLNSWEKKRSKRQRRKGKIYPFEYKVSIFNIVLYSIGFYFHHQSHPQLGIFLLWLRLFILSGFLSPLFSSSIGHLLTWGVHLSESYLLPFHTLHGAPKARILKWFAMNGIDSIYPSIWPRMGQTETPTLLDVLHCYKSFVRKLARWVEKGGILCAAVAHQEHWTARMIYSKNNSSSCPRGSHECRQSRHTETRWRN